ncbi:unnamed protein product [Zymoseptoria tritici ST99CH_1A5]|uniref:Uncharacterized protein n=1 Tax=Zymoseptoria tritici ST99CH_1A5 TaxID=1276529 RepID=A0A1Y6L7X9_ZYMTR|nr:unnamed protein product [Zymoseptoria tritici ST99CH_1A5]
MDHHRPHPSSAFEGYYSKFDLPSGGHLALVACKVRNARSKPHMLSFTYVPPGSSSSKVYQREVWPDSMTFTPLPGDEGFRIDIPSIGVIHWTEKFTQYYLDHSDFSFHATATNRTPWCPSQANSTPESWLVYLPLPLHWHVHSLASTAEFELSIPSDVLPEEDKKGTALVHDEKNWAKSFPSAHIWVQGRSSDQTSICLAGGQILGMEAFLLGYRSPTLNLSFIPPFALRIFGWSPFLSYIQSWDEKKFDLTVSSWRYKLEVQATAPKGTFFSLSSPFPEGHRENYLGQSFAATIRVRIWERGWLGPFGGGEWARVREEVFEGGSLEFGGEFYPPRGSEVREH